MKIMVVGGGGREHAIIRKLSENPRRLKRFTRCPEMRESRVRRCACP